MRLAALSALVAGVLLALPASSPAATLCVGNPGGTCDATYPDIQAAMFGASEASRPGRDTIRIGKGLFEGPPIFQPNAAQNPVDVVGSGQDLDGTRLRSTTAQAAIRLTTASTIENVRVLIPPAGTGGLDLEAADAKNVTVFAEPGNGSVTGKTGVYMRNTSSLRSSTVNLVTAPTPSYAVSISDTGTHVIEDALLDGADLVDLTGYATEATIRRIRNTGRCSNCIYVRPAAPEKTVDVSDSLLRVAQEGQGLYAQPGTTINARNMTVVGVPGTNTAGARANGSGQVNVLDSIIREVNYALYTDGQAHLSIDYSDFDPDKLQKVGVAGLFAIGEHNVNVDPKFMNGDVGDYRLASGSPVAERASAGPGAADLDLERKPRLADADGDGNAIRDMGAYEYAGAPYALPPVEYHNGGGIGGPGGGGGGGTIQGPAMTVTGKTVKLDTKRKVKVKLTCPHSESGTCTGSVALTTDKKIRPKPGKKPVRVKVGTVKFSAIPGGATRTVTIKVSKTSAAILRRFKSLKVTATITASWPVGEPKITKHPLTLKIATTR
jgi:hypothetical protein